MAVFCFQEATIKVLLLDIETAPNLVHVWGLWQQNVAINQIISSGYVLCWSAKWLGEKEVFFDSTYQSRSKKMIVGIHKLMDEADAIVHYNGTKFDIPTLNKEFLLRGLNPPSPSKEIDLLKTARGRFRFSSNKLDFIAQQLGLGKKTPHIGHQLWIDCMAKIPEAWATMEKYNKNDVVLLEKVYHKLLPWIKNHPNVNAFNGVDGVACPNCGSDKAQSRGYAVTTTLMYRRLHCKSCGNWFRGATTVTPRSVDGRFVNI